eukprot:874799-Pelagomonas_calceolata.AAC.4
MSMFLCCNAACHDCANTCRHMPMHACASAREDVASSKAECAHVQLSEVEPGGFVPDRSVSKVVIKSLPLLRNPDLPIDPETGEPIESEATNDVSEGYFFSHIELGIFERTSSANGFGSRESCNWAITLEACQGRQSH